MSEEQKLSPGYKDLYLAGKVPGNTSEADTWWEYRIEELIPTAAEEKAGERIVAKLNQ